MGRKNHRATTRKVKFYALLLALLVSPQLLADVIERTASAVCTGGEYSTTGSTDDCLPDPITLVAGDGLDTTSTNVLMTTNKSGGTFYIATYEDTDPAPADCAAVVAGSGATDTSSKAGAATIDFDSTDNVSGLVAGTDYIVYGCGVESARLGNVISYDFTTLGGSAALDGFFLDGTSGDDANDCTSDAQACKTWTRILAVSGGIGVDVWVKAGTSYDFSGNDDVNEIVLGVDGSMVDDKKYGCYYMVSTTETECTDSQTPPIVTGTMTSACRAAETCTWVWDNRFSGFVSITGDYVTWSRIDVRDVAYNGILVEGTGNIVEESEVSWCGMACIRAAAGGVVNFLVQNNHAHHAPYAYYANRVLGETTHFPLVNTSGGPPVIMLATANAAATQSATAAGNRVHTSYREGIGCFRLDSNSRCWMIGNILSGIRTIGLYAGQSYQVVMESNIIYNATDDDWYIGAAAFTQGAITFGVENNDELTSPAFHGENEESYARNNLIIGVYRCFGSQFSQKAIDGNFENTMDISYGTCIDPVNTNSDSSGGAVMRIANANMVGNEIQNTIGYAPQSAREVQITSAPITTATNFWDAAVAQAGAADAGDITGTPSLVGSLSATFTTASPPSPANYEYSAGGVDGVGDGTALTTTRFVDADFPQWEKVTWWDDNGYTKPTRAQHNKEADIDFMGVDRDDANPDIGAFEF